MSLGGCLCWVCTVLREALPAVPLLQWVVLGHWHNFCSILGSVLFPTMGDKSEWIELNSCLWINPSVDTASAAVAKTAGQNSWLLKQKPHSSKSSSIPLQPLQVNNCQYHGLEHCFFYAIDNSLKWYCLARKRVMGEQARFKPMNSSCFQLTSAPMPSCPVRKISAAARQKVLEYPHRCWVLSA